ncbi:hypothetical protein [Proteus mirabilis]|nr:hypothetical protein [Proteus mirabilis]
MVISFVRLGCWPVKKRQKSGIAPEGPKQRGGRCKRCNSALSPHCQGSA